MNPYSLEACPLTVSLMVELRHRHHRRPDYIPRQPKAPVYTRIALDSTLCTFRLVSAVTRQGIYTKDIAIPPKDAAPICQPYKQLNASNSAS